MKKIITFKLCCFLLFVGCKKAETTNPIIVPSSSAIATPKLIIVSGRISDGTTTTTHFTNILQAYNPDGSPAWKTTGIGNGYIDSHIYYNRGLFFLCTSDYNNTSFINAIDAKNGAVLWSSSNSGYLVSPSFYNDTLYCSNTSIFGNYICAYLAKTGSLLWTLPIEPNDSYALTKTEGNMLYFNSGYSKNLHAIDLKTRLTKWSGIVDGPATDFRLRILDSQLIVKSNYSITSYNKANGRKQWSKVLDAIIAFTTGNNAIFITQENVAQFAFDIASGNLIWQNAFPSSVIYTSRPYILGNNLYYGGFDNASFFFASLNAKTGVLNWRKNQSSFYLNNIVVGDRIFALRNKTINDYAPAHYLMRFDAKSGAVMDSTLFPYDELDNIGVINSNDSLITPA